MPNDIADQKFWIRGAELLLTELYGGATTMPMARGMWRNPQTGAIVEEDVALIHSYAANQDAEDPNKLRQLGRFLHRLGRETNQGEVGLVVGDVFHRIRRFTIV